MGEGVYSANVWRPKQGTGWKHPEGKCHASVSSGGYYSHMCGKPAKVKCSITSWGRSEGIHEFCGVHDPIRAAARKKARDEKWRAKWDLEEARRAESGRLQRLREAALAAIIQIAAGYNDARGLAQSVLDEHAATGDPTHD
ncbi:hypothetical protein WG907_04235 [Sphingobium sp. AN558]|uniref:hypothetical protein n=1 Tax=Sphingobium sp. AN558 TaxID=3133442 RepID=UPI0030BC51F3